MSEPIKFFDIGGLKVVTSPHVGEDELIVISDGKSTFPPEWETMDEDERLKWCLDHGQIVMVRNLETFKARR